MMVRARLRCMPSRTRGQYPVYQLFRFRFKIPNALMGDDVSGRRMGAVPDPRF